MTSPTQTIAQVAENGSATEQLNHAGNGQSHEDCTNIVSLVRRAEFGQAGNVIETYINSQLDRVSSVTNRYLLKAVGVARGYVGALVLGPCEPVAFKTSEVPLNRKQLAVMSGFDSIIRRIVCLFCLTLLSHEALPVFIYSRFLLVTICMLPFAAFSKVELGDMVVELVSGTLQNAAVGSHRVVLTSIVLMSVPVSTAMSWVLLVWCCSGLWRTILLAWQTRIGHAMILHRRMRGYSNGAPIERFQFVSAKVALSKPAVSSDTAVQTNPIAASAAFAALKAKYENSAEKAVRQSIVETASEVVLSAVDSAVASLSADPPAPTFSVSSIK